MSKRVGRIESLGKFDLNANVWRMAANNYELGRSFSIANYETIKVNEQEGFHYIIFARGSRVEEHSKDFVTIGENKAGMNRIINYFKNQNNNCVIQLFLMDADAPIKEDAKRLAQHIDHLAMLPTTKSINLIGLSKSGAMNLYVPKNFKNYITFTKTNIYSIAAPYLGTRIASPKFVYDDIKKVIVSMFGNNKFAETVYNKAIEYYGIVSSDSHMVYDIAVPDGVTEEKMDVYDSSFISDILSDENLTSLERVRTFKNFVAGIDNKTLPEAIRTGNLTGIGLCVLDKVVFNNDSDGFVPIASQRQIENTCLGDKVKSHILVSSHHDIMSHQRVLNEILTTVNDTISEQAEIETYQMKLMRTKLGMNR